MVDGSTSLWVIDRIRAEENKQEKSIIHSLRKKKETLRYSLLQLSECDAVRMTSTFKMVVAQLEMASSDRTHQIGGNV